MNYYNINNGEFKEVRKYRDNIKNIIILKIK